MKQFVRSGLLFVTRKEFVAQYLVSILTGFANLLSLSLLGKLFHDASVYSAVATILTAFSSYFVFLELGYNAELTKDIQKQGDLEGRQKGESTGFLSLLHLRLGISIMLVAVALCQGLAGDLGLQGTLAFGVFALSFLVYSWLATLDSYYLAKGIPVRAVFVKMARIFVAVVLPGLIYFFPTENLTAVFSGYAAIVLAVAAVLTWFHRELVKNLFAFGWIPPRDSARSFVLRCLKSAATPSFGILATLVIQTTLYRSQGLDNLATYVAALSLLSPMTIAMQIISQLTLKDLAMWAQSDLPSAKKHIFKTNSMTVVVGVLGILFVLFLYKVGVVHAILKHVEPSFPYLWLGLGLHSILIALAVPHANFLQLRHRYRSMFQLALGLFVLTCLMVGGFSLYRGVAGYVWSLSFASLINYILLRRLSHQQMV